jgi:hypothetical protein
MGTLSRPVPGLIIALAGLLFFGSAEADESYRVRPLVPERPDTEDFSFESAYATGVRIRIGAPDAAGRRMFRVEHCGSRTDSTLEFALSYPGYVLVVYETGESQQRRDTCSVSLRVLFTNDRYFSDSVTAASVEIGLYDGRCGYFYGTHSARCEAVAK